MAELRTSFITEEGKTLVALDYSQIELRILAHKEMPHDFFQAGWDNRTINISTKLKGE